MHSLPLFHRIAGQTVIVLGEGEAAEAKRRLVERAGGLLSSDPDAAVQIAFVALDEPEAAAAALKARGVLVNVVDRPDLCDFTTPSVLERGDVLIAVATGGTSAGLAKALRMRLEALLPQSLGGLAAALGAAKAMLRERWPDPAARRRALDAALGAGGPLDPLSDHPDHAVYDWFGQSAEPQIEVAEFILTGADPDELTVRQARLLAGADLILHDSGIDRAVLNRGRADAVRQLIAGDTPQIPAGTNAVILRSR
ncbi:MAG: NAD(P)-dependent oxidoreductase [Novosphingobium sp.]